MKNTDRFSNRVENYVRYRPHYPFEIIPFLKQQINLDSKWTLADIGSGTGISSDHFIQNGNLVYAVEPNQEMRKAAEIFYKGNTKFISISATAENTSLPDHSIDLILAGQAFHWFDLQAAKKELRRIAKPNAFLVLMWNERDVNSAFQQQYEKMLLELAPDYEAVCQHNIDEAAIRDFFAPQTYTLQTFSNAQLFDLEGLKGRLLSCSYAPLEQDPHFLPLMERLKELFEKFNVEGKVEFKYRCQLYYGLFF